MNTIVIKGAAARLQWGYHPAASLSSWSVIPDQDGGGVLHATVIEMDTFRAAQQPLTLVVPRPSGTSWRWMVHSLQIAGASLTAALGPLEG